MTKEKINTLIAEISNWQPKYGCPCGNSNCQVNKDQYPNFFKDLNALHIAENTMNFQERITWTNVLRDICHEENTYYMSATAPQRCKAFLKVKGKWND